MKTNPSSAWFGAKPTKAPSSSESLLAGLVWTTLPDGSKIYSRTTDEAMSCANDVADHQAEQLATMKRAANRNYQRR